MNTKWMFAPILAGAALLAGCQTFPPGAERGPDGTMAYDVLIEATPPGAKIEVNGEQIGNTPLHIKIFGDTDGTFHDFGSDYYAIKALPLATNQYVQSRYFGTGRWFGPEDRIPQRIYFDMNNPSTPPAGAPGYGYPAYGPPIYYGPGYYYEPGIRFYFGPPAFHYYGHGSYGHGRRY